jgi:hypothetical protein
MFFDLEFYFLVAAIFSRRWAPFGARNEREVRLRISGKTFFLSHFPENENLNFLLLFRSSLFRASVRMLSLWEISEWCLQFISERRKKQEKPKLKDEENRWGKRFKKIVWRSARLWNKNVKIYPREKSLHFDVACVRVGNVMQTFWSKFLFSFSSFMNFPSSSWLLIFRLSDFTIGSFLFIAY